MKFVPERGDTVLYKVASDGHGNVLYEMGKVQAIIDDTVYLGGDLTVNADDTLPCKKDVRELSEKVNDAYTYCKDVYGHMAIKEVA